jgi:DNA-binding response OmpR family regulator
MKTRILYVEDDESLAFLTKDNLEMQGYQVIHLSDGHDVLEAFQSQHIDICILDVMLPGVDGFKIAEEIKRKSFFTPIIFLTAKTLLEDKIEGLGIGADDYITKPFSIKELVLRIEAILRRYNQQVRVGSKIGDLEFDNYNYCLTIGAKKFRLTARECDLLKLFFDNLNQTITRSDILLKIWGSDDFFLGRSLDVFISRIRKLLKNSSCILIENIHGVGFKMICHKD